MSSHSSDQVFVKTKAQALVVLRKHEKERRGSYYSPPVGMNVKLFTELCDLGFAEISAHGFKVTKSGMKATLKDLEREG